MQYHWLDKQLSGGLQQLEAGSVIQITFSTDYQDYFNQYQNITTAILQQNCYPLYGFGSGETLNCTVLPMNHSIQIQLTQNAQLPSLGINISNILNPGSAKSVQFRIDLIDPKNNQIDSTNSQLSSNFSLTFKPDTLQSIQISSSNDTVGQYGNLTVQIITKNKLIGGCNIIIQFPKWGPFLETYFQNSQCQLLLKNSSINQNSLCTFQSLQFYDVITVQNAFTQNVTSGQTIVLVFQNVRNSPSLRGVNNITVMTQTVKDLAIVDTRNDGYFATSKMMTVPASNYNIQFQSPVVSTLTQMMLTIQLSNPVLAGGVIKVTVPPEIRLQDSTNTITYLTTVFSKGKNSGNLQFSLQSSSLNTSLKDTIVITNPIQQNMNVGEFLFIYFQNVFTPVSSKITSPFRIDISEVFQNVQYLIEGNYQGVTTSVNQQNLTQYTFSTTNQNVFSPFDSIITARFVGIVQKNDYIELQYPNTFTLNQRQNLSNIQCNSTLNQQTLVGNCLLIQSNNTIRIHQLCSQDVDYSIGGGLLNFTIQNLFLNPDSEQPISSGFNISLKDPTGNIIASYNPQTDTANNFYHVNSQNINVFKVKSNSLITGKQTTLNFQGKFQGFYNYSLSQLNFVMIPPSQVQLLSNQSVICGSYVNISTSIQCQIVTFNGQQAVQVQFQNFSLLNTSEIQINLDIGTFINPYSTQITDSFQIYLTNQQNYKIAYQTQQIQYSISQGSSFQTVQVIPQSTINGASTIYNFQITSLNPIPSQSTIQILPPQNIIFSTFSGTQIQCTGSGVLQQKILCYLIQNQIVINLFFDAVQQVNQLNFNLFPVINPPSLQPTQSFSITILTNSGFIISQQNYNITVQNQLANTITDANVQSSNPALGADSSYLVQFTPINALPLNSVINVYVPSILQRDQSENFNCSTALNSSLATIWPCNFNSTSRIITVYPIIKNFNNLPSKIKFYINGFQNPMQPQFNESFQIYTFDQNGYAMDQVTQGLQVSQTCDYPCLTCGLSSSTCLSCKIGDTYQYLFNNTCISSCPSGFFEDSTFICKQCSSQCQQCKGSANFCTQCSNQNQKLFIPTGSCTDSCPAGQYSDKGTGSCTNCDQTCKVCQGINQCSSCQNNLLLYNGTCRTDCPSNMIASADQQQCINCQNPCQSCAVSPDKCTACNQNSANPFLYGTKCVSKCPAGYSGSFLNPYHCEVTKEQIIPFVFLAAVILFSLVIGIVKLCKKDDFHFKNTLIAIVSVVCQANWGFVLYLTIIDEQVQSTVIICFGLGMLLILNIVFFSLHLRVMRHDEFYSHWRKDNAKKECFLIFLSLVTNFQFYRLIFQSLSTAIKSKTLQIEEERKQSTLGADAEANKTQTEQQIIKFKTQDENTVKQIFNQLTIIMMCCVLAPIIVQNIYNLFFTFPGRQLFWEDIESIFITFFLLLVLIYDTIKKSKKIQFLKLQKLLPQDKNDMSGIPKDLVIKTVSNDIDNLDQLLNNQHEVKRFRDILSALLKHPKYIASQEDDLSSIASPELIKQKKQNARMNRAGMNNEPQNTEMTGVNGVTMRAVDTTMHTEENFMGTSTDRNLLNGSTLKENHNIFTDRSLIVKNLFQQNKTEREYHSPIDEHQDDEDDANVRSSISPNLKKKISSQEQSNENINTDHYNSNNITNRDFDDLNRQNIHGGTDPAILKQLQQTNIENLKESVLLQERLQEAQFIQKKSMIKERSNDKQNNRLLRSHQQPLTGILQESQVNDHLQTDMSGVNEVIIQRQEEKLRGLSSLKTVQDHFSLVSTNQLKSEPEQIENAPKSTLLNKQIVEINDQMDNSYEQREGGALQVSRNATPTNYHMTLGLDNQRHENIFGQNGALSSKNDQSKVFSFKQTPNLSMGNNTENKASQGNENLSNQKDFLGRPEQTTQRVSLLTTDDNFNKEIKVCQDLNLFKKQEKIVSEREQEINQLIFKQKEKNDTFLRPLNKTIQIPDNKENSEFQLHLMDKESLELRPNTVFQDPNQNVIDKNEFINKPKEALKESSWVQQDTSSANETIQFSGTSSEQKRKRGEWKLKQISNQIKIKNKSSNYSKLSQNQQIDNQIEINMNFDNEEENQKIEFNIEEKNDDNDNSNNVSPARTLKRKKRLVKKLIQINEDGSKTVLQQDNIVQVQEINEEKQEQKIQNNNLLGLTGLGQGLIEQSADQNESRPQIELKNKNENSVKSFRKNDQDLSLSRIRIQNQNKEIVQSTQKQEMKQNLSENLQKSLINQNSIENDSKIQKIEIKQSIKDQVSNFEQNINQNSIQQKQKSSENHDEIKSTVRKPPIYESKNKHEAVDYLDQQLQNMENQSRIQKFAKTSEKSQKKEISGVREMNMTLQNFKKNLDQQLAQNQMVQTMQGFSDNHQQIKSMLSGQESGSFDAPQIKATRTGQISMNGSQYQFNGTHKSGHVFTNQLLNTDRKEKDILKKSANYRVGKAIVEGSSYENVDKRSSSQDHWGQASSKNFENFSSPPRKFNDKTLLPVAGIENSQFQIQSSNRQLQYEGGNNSF